MKILLLTLLANNLNRRSPNLPKLVLNLALPSHLQTQEQLVSKPMEAKMVLKIRLKAHQRKLKEQNLPKILKEARSKIKIRVPNNLERLKLHLKSNPLSKIKRRLNSSKLRRTRS